MEDVNDTPINPVHERRALIKTEPAPHPRHDAIVTLSGTFSDKILRLRYIPDRDLILPTSLSTYLEAIMNDNASSLEALSQLILEDINDQLIPSWLEVSLIDKGETFTHEVRIEDRQPHWKDRGLLDRLEP
jgi:hypothetical protein